MKVVENYYSLSAVDVYIHNIYNIIHTCLNTMYASAVSDERSLIADAVAQFWSFLRAEPFFRLNWTRHRSRRSSRTQSTCWPAKQRHCPSALLNNYKLSLPIKRERKKSTYNRYRVPTYICMYNLCIGRKNKIIKNNYSTAAAAADLFRASGTLYYILLAQTPGRLITRGPSGIYVPGTYIYLYIISHNTYVCWAVGIGIGITL